MIVLLRGVNVGGRHRLPMEVLRRLSEEIGCLNPSSYIQSGNLVFETKLRDAAEVVERLEEAIETQIGFRPAVIVRTVEEFRQVVAHNPFPAEAKEAPNKLAVCFFRDLPSADEDRDLTPYAKTGERIERSGRELYIYFPVGIGKSKLQIPKLEPVLKGAARGPNLCTMRNWNTVLRLLEMAESRQGM